MQAGETQGSPVPLETGWLRSVQVNRRYYGEQLGFMRRISAVPPLRDTRRAVARTG
jgi:hypothetical protein